MSGRIRGVPAATDSANKLGITAVWPLISAKEDQQYASTSIYDECR